MSNVIARNVEWAKPKRAHHRHSPRDGGHGACAPLPTLHLAGMFFGENGARVKPARDDAAEARRLRHSGARRRREL